MKYEWKTFSADAWLSTVGASIDALLKKVETEGYEPAFTNIVDLGNYNGCLVFITGKRLVEVGYREPG